MYCALSQFVSRVCLFQFSPVTPVLGHFHSCLCKKVKEDKKRAQEQYETFNKLESVGLGYYLDREQISLSAADSWTSVRDWVYWDVLWFAVRTFLAERCQSESDTKHHKSEVATCHASFPLQKTTMSTMSNVRELCPLNESRLKWKRLLEPSKSSKFRRREREDEGHLFLREFFSVARVVWTQPSSLAWNCYFLNIFTFLSQAFAGYPIPLVGEKMCLNPNDQT